MHKYFTYGLNVHSNIELPLWPAEGDHVLQAPDIVMKCLESRPLSRELPERLERHISSEGAELVYDGVGAFRLQPGRPVQAVAEPVPECPDGIIPLFLTGSLLAVAIYYHGFLPLHGCALDINGKTAIFMGSRCMGKSSLCAALCKMGHRIIADDISAVSWIDGRAHVMPGYSRMKLVSDVVDALDIPREELVVLHELQHKTGWFRPEDRFDQPRPIDALFFLGIGERGIRPVGGLDAFAMIQRNAMPSQWEFEGGKGHFSHCGRLIREVPTYGYIRERNLDQLMDQAEWISQFWEETDSADRAVCGLMSSH